MNPNTMAELQRKPVWLRVQPPGGPNFLRLKRLMRQSGLNTVCEEARCPNIGECWEAGAATFMLLGYTCTRACGFCAVNTGRPLPVDRGEPLRVALAVKRLGLRHAVITSVNRDDEADGGASIFAETIHLIRATSPGATIEVLTPDFAGNWDALATVIAARPDIFNHNIETVPRLYARVRPKARYQRSLELLRRSRELNPDIPTKSGIMLGLGETQGEISAVLRDLVAAGVSILTLGQYLQPSAKRLLVHRFYEPAEFAALADQARELGFQHVESGPLVRSSYHADRQLAHLSLPD